MFLVAVIFNFYIFGKGKKYKKKLHRKLFYGEIITCFLEAYLELIIAGNLTIKEPLFTTSGEIIANMVGYLCVIVPYIVLPITIIWVLYRPINELFVPKL